MRRDPSVQSNIDRIDRRKQNRIRPVRTLPNAAEVGDAVLMDGDFFVYNGDWVSVTQPLRTKIEALEQRAQELQGYRETAREQIAEISHEIERQKLQETAERGVAFNIENGLDDDPIGLQAELNTRPLSDLEAAFIDFTFCDTIEAENISIRYPETLISRGSGNNIQGRFIDYERNLERVTFGGESRIPDGTTTDMVEISRSNFRYVDDISSRSTLANTDLVKPQNVEMFAVIVHEFAHHFQYEYGLLGNDDRAGIYAYTAEDLKDPNNMGREQVASAVQDWFVIAWQLEHGTGKVNLTNYHYWNHTIQGRFDKIAEIPHVDTDLSFDDGHATITVPQRLVTREKAEELSEYYDELISWMCLPRSPSKFIAVQARLREAFINVRGILEN